MLVSAAETRAKDDSSADFKDRAGRYVPKQSQRGMPALGWIFLQVRTKTRSGKVESAIRIECGEQAVHRSTLRGQPQARVAGM